MASAVMLAPAGPLVVHVHTMPRPDTSAAAGAASIDDDPLFLAWRSAVCGAPTTLVVVASGPDKEEAAGCFTRWASLISCPLQYQQQQQQPHSMVVLSRGGFELLAAPVVDRHLGDGICASTVVLCDVHAASCSL